MSVSFPTNFNPGKKSFRHRRITAIWKLLPALVIFLLLIPSGLPKEATPVTTVLPPFALLAVFFWSIQAPERLGYPVIFIAGLFHDIITGTPFGSSAFLWCIMRFMIVTSRKDIADQGFFGGWSFLAVLLFFVFGLKWAVVALYYGIHPDLFPSFMQWVLSILFYPLMHTLFYQVDRAYFRRHWYLLKPE